MARKRFYFDFQPYKLIRVANFLNRTELTPWRQNPKVHHRTHNSPPTVPILSKVNPFHPPPADLPKVHFDPILPSTPWFFKWSFSFGILSNKIFKSEKEFT
jgi:hypothetical protein